VQFLIDRYYLAPQTAPPDPPSKMAIQSGAPETKPLTGKPIVVPPKLSSSLDSSQHYLAQGNHFYDREDFPQAIYYYKLALAANPGE